MEKHIMIESPRLDWKACKNCVRWQINSRDAPEFIPGWRGWGLRQKDERI